MTETDPRGGGAPQSASTPSAGQALAVYTGLRLALFVASLAVLAALGRNGLPAVLVALVLSSLLSLVLLRRQRDVVAAALAGRTARRQQEKARLRDLLDEG